MPPRAIVAGGWERSRAVIVTQVAAQRGKRPTMALDPDERYPTGTRVVLVASAGHTGAPQVLSSGLAAAGAPSLSPAADHVLLAGRTEKATPWGIHEVDLFSGQRKLVFGGARDCTQPTYLPGDLIACSCADVATTTGPRTWSLFTGSRRGGPLQRITFSPGSAFDPTPLPDGRILFSMQQSAGSGRPADGAVALFTVNPDGTLLEPFTGSHVAPAVRRRARPSGDGGVLYIRAGASGDRALVERVEMSRPLSSRRALTHDIEPLAIEWLSPGELLVAGWPSSRHASGTAGVFIWSSGPTGRRESLLDDPAWHAIEAVAVRPRLARLTSRTRPSAVRTDTRTGLLVCTDAGHSDGRHGPPAGSPAPVAVTVETLAMGSAGKSRLEQLGRVDLAADASFHIEVPADIPLRVTGHGAEGQQLGRSDWFWVRPGEVRTCFGCHESRASAPANRPIDALATEPVRLPRSSRLETP